MDLSQDPNHPHQNHIDVVKGPHEWTREKGYQPVETPVAEAPVSEPEAQVTGE